MCLASPKCIDPKNELGIAVTIEVNRLGQVKTT
jgi:hypothetical protein